MSRRIVAFSFIQSKGSWAYERFFLVSRSCQTCHLNSFQCPGHFGHIELPTPVFHPLFITNMYNLLRGCCLFCHRFKITEFQVSGYYRG